MFFNEGIINEVYFGKSNELLKIEKQLDLFRQKHMKQYVFSSKVNSDPDLLKFNRMMEEYFGFGTFCLYVISAAIENAFTIPVSASIEYYTKRIAGDYVIADKRGFKFRKEADYSCFCCCFTGILFNPHYTTPECMAVILHEVGHNFQAAINRPSCVLNALDMALRIYEGIVFCIPANIILSSNTLLGAISNLEQSTAQRLPYITDLSDTMISIWSTAMTIREIILGKIPNYLSFNIRLLIRYLFAALRNLTNIFHLIFMPLVYHDEKIADNFVTAYGYGAEISSAVNKLENYECSPNEIDNAIGKIPFIGPLFNLVILPGEIIYGMTSDHPGGVNRAADQLHYLQAELKKTNLDPKMRKCIEADIKACNKSIDRITTAQHQVYNDPALFKHILNGWFYKLTGGKNFRDALMNDQMRFAEYDYTYMKALNIK